MATLGLLQIKVFWNKGYDVKIYAHDFTKNVIPRLKIYNYVADGPIKQKFGDSSISLRECSYPQF